MQVTNGTTAANDGSSSINCLTNRFKVVTTTADGEATADSGKAAL